MHLTSTDVALQRLPLIGQVAHRLAQGRFRQDGLGQLTAFGGEGVDGDRKFTAFFAVGAYVYDNSQKDKIAAGVTIAGRRVDQTPLGPGGGGGASSGRSF